MNNFLSLIYRFTMNSLKNSQKVDLDTMKMVQKHIKDTDFFGKAIKKEEAKKIVDKEKLFVKPRGYKNTSK
jgi:hypothetical protein